jgi:hypothetical protein
MAGSWCVTCSNTDSSSSTSTSTSRAAAAAHACVLQQVIAVAALSQSGIWLKLFGQESVDCRSYSAHTVCSTAVAAISALWSKTAATATDKHMLLFCR